MLSLISLISQIIWVIQNPYFPLNQSIYGMENTLFLFGIVWLMKYIKYWNTQNLITVVGTIWLIIKEIVHKIHTQFSFDDFPSFINLEIRRGDELKKHYFLYNGVTQLFIKLCFEIFDLREFQSSLCFCTKRRKT